MHSKTLHNYTAQQLYNRVQCLLYQETVSDLPVPKSDASLNLFVQFFDEFSIFHQDKKLPKFKAKKQRAILAFFLLNPRISWTKEQLIRRFWDDYMVNSPENNLKVTLSYIRKQFASMYDGMKVILNEHGKYIWNPEISIQTDVDDFKRRYFDVISFKEDNSSIFFHHLAMTINAYSSSFLDEFKETTWLQHSKEQLNGYFISCLELLSQYCISQKAIKAAILVNRKICQIESINEAAARRLIDCYLQIGERAKAIEQYNILNDQLQESYGIEPAEETKNILNHILKKAG